MEERRAYLLLTTVRQERQSTQADTRLLSNAAALNLDGHASPLPAAK